MKNDATALHFIVAMSMAVSTLALVGCTDQNAGSGAEQVGSEQKLKQLKRKLGLIQ
jgi:hypothetical protein